MAALVGEVVFLQATVGLVGGGHCKQAIGQCGFEITLAKQLAILQAEDGLQSFAAQFPLDDRKQLFDLGGSGEVTGGWLLFEDQKLPAPSIQTPRITLRSLQNNRCFAQQLLVIIKTPSDFVATCPSYPNFLHRPVAKQPCQRFMVINRQPVAGPGDGHTQQVFADFSRRITFRVQLTILQA